MDQSILEKLMSRKLGTSIGAVAVEVFGSKTLTPLQQVVIGAIACVYIVAQTFVDHKTIDAKAKTLSNAITEGVALGEKTTS